MIKDIRTVMWKERKGLLRQRGSRARFFLVLLTPIMLGIGMPVQFGAHWLDSGWSLMGSVITPMLLVGISVPEAFAGERERHTLETLLASRLPDRAILFGKLGPSVAYGWVLTLVLLLVSLVPANAVGWNGHVTLYKPDVLLVNIAASLFMSLFVAGLGILISLRSTTAQGAQQALIGILLVPVMVLQLVPMLTLSLVPDGGRRLEEILNAAGEPALVTATLAAWALIDLALLSIVMARFERARLV